MPIKNVEITDDTGTILLNKQQTKKKVPEMFNEKFNVQRKIRTGRIPRTRQVKGSVADAINQILKNDGSEIVDQYLKDTAEAETMGSNQYYEMLAQRIDTDADKKRVFPQVYRNLKRAFKCFSKNKAHSNDMVSMEIRDSKLEHNQCHCTECNTQRENAVQLRRSLGVVKAPFVTNCKKAPSVAK